MSNKPKQASDTQATKLVQELAMPKYEYQVSDTGSGRAVSGERQPRQREFQALRNLRASQR